MKRIGLILTLLFSGVLFATVPMLAQPGPGGSPGPGHEPGGGPGEFSLRMLERALDLSSDQRDQVRSILEEERANLGDPESRMATLQELQAKIVAATIAEGVMDEAALRSLYQERSELFLQDFLVHQSSLRRVLLEVLTEDQREKAIELLSSPPRMGPMGRH